MLPRDHERHNGVLGNHDLTTGHLVGDLSGAVRSLGFPTAVPPAGEPRRLAKPGRELEDLMNGARLTLLAAICSTLLGAACAGAHAEEPSVSGTVWRFGAKDDTVRFLPGGIVRFDALDATGRWRQDREQLSFDCNGYTGYEVVVSGDKMKGHWRRLKGDSVGLTHPTSLTKVSEGAGPPTRPSWAPRIAGTRWRFDGTGTTVKFLPDSRVRFDTGDTGRWSQVGDRLTFDRHGGFVVFEVTVRGDRMEGKMRVRVADEPAVPTSLRRADQDR
jgi:hypothetical protein